MTKHARITLFIVLLPVIAAVSLGVAASRYAATMHAGTATPAAPETQPAPAAQAAAEEAAPAEDALAFARTTLGATVYGKAADGLDLEGVAALTLALKPDGQGLAAIGAALDLDDAEAFPAAWTGERAQLATRLMGLGISAGDLARAVGYVLLRDERNGDDIARLLCASGQIGSAALRERIARPYPEDVITLPERIDLKADLVWREGVRLLTLRGSDAERGYAHGRLLAREIVTFMRQALSDFIFLSAADRSPTQIRELQHTSFVYTPAAMAELAGMLRGIEDALPAAERMIGERPLDLVDLKALNSVADWVRFGCSSFTARGSLAGEKGPLVARNLDYFTDMNYAIVSNPVVLAHLPLDTARKPWLSATWPGQIGLYSAMNADGATLLIHDVLDCGARRIGIVPRGMAARDLIERLNISGDPVEAAAAIFRGHRAYAGSSFHFAAPDGKGGVVCAALEYDGRQRVDGGVTVRRAGDNKEAGDFLVVTNHYCKRANETLPFKGSDRRYRTLEEQLAKLSAEKKVLTFDEARRMLAGVAFDKGLVLTMHSVLAYPLAGEFHVAFATREQTAPHNSAARFTTADLKR